MRSPSASRFAVLAGASGLVAGLVMAAWQMMYAAAAGDGFFTPINVCMSSFVYRGDAQMMIDEMMKNPSMSMNAPIDPAHLIVGAILHMMFSIVVGIVFAAILVALVRSIAWLGTYAGYVVGALAGAVLLYLLMMYAVLPVANPLMVDATPRGAFFVGHLAYGAAFGLLAFRMLGLRERRAAVAAT